MNLGKPRTSEKSLLHCLACGLLACSMTFASIGCDAGGAGDAAPAGVDGARGTGDDNPVVDDSTDADAAGDDTTTTE